MSFNSLALCHPPGLNLAPLISSWCAYLEQVIACNVLWQWEARAQALIENHRSSPSAIARCEWWSPYAQTYPLFSPVRLCVLVMPACHYHHVSNAHLVCVWISEYKHAYVCVVVRAVSLPHLLSLVSFLPQLLTACVHWPLNSPGLHFLPHAESVSVIVPQIRMDSEGATFTSTQLSG